MACMRPYRVLEYGSHKGSFRVINVCWYINIQLIEKVMFIKKGQFYRTNIVSRYSVLAHKVLICDIQAVHHYVENNINSTKT